MLKHTLAAAAATLAIAAMPGIAAAQTTVTTQTQTTDQGGTLSGVAGGAAVGAVVGGPAGAVIGGVAGGMAGAAIDPPDTVRTYVTEHQVEPVTVEQEVQVGVALPETVVLHEVPDYEYQYTYVNGQPVLVEPGTRKVVYVVR